MLFRVLLVSFIVAISACATASRINRISLGMDKGRVIDEMGDPSSTRASGDTEVLEYMLTATREDAIAHRNTAYWVELKDGKVTQYGRAGDFGGARSPSGDYQQEQASGQAMQNAGNALTGLSKQLQQQRQPVAAPANPNRQCTTRPDGYGGFTTQCFP